MDGQDVKHTPLLQRTFFAQDAITLARALIGTQLFVDGVGGIITETEAYTADDPASHSFNGPTARNAAMFGPPGHAYVYRIMGLHWCLDVVCGPPHGGCAVLIRAIAPTHGIHIMAARRSVSDPRLLCSGPGRLCQALGITGALNGAPLDAPPFAFMPGRTDLSIVTGPRIGITRGLDRPWRFGLAGSPFLSRPFT